MHWGMHSLYMMPVESQDFGCTVLVLMSATVYEVHRQLFLEFMEGIRLRQCWAFARPGLGAVQRVSRVNCSTVVVTGYLPQTNPAALETQVTLAVLNGTIGSPCGGTFFGANASTIVQTRYTVLVYA